LAVRSTVDLDGSKLERIEIILPEIALEIVKNYANKRGCFLTHAAL